MSASIGGGGALPVANSLTGGVTTGTAQPPAPNSGQAPPIGAPGTAPSAATQALAGPTGGDAATPTGAAQAAAGAAQATGGGGANDEALIAALRSLIEVLNQLVAALAAQAGSAPGGGPSGAPGKTDDVGQSSGGTPGKVVQQETPTTKVQPPTQAPGQVLGTSGAPAQQPPVKFGPPVKVTLPVQTHVPPVKFEPPMKVEPPTQVGGEYDPGQLPTQRGGVVQSPAQGGVGQRDDTVQTG
jgi:hypothetical protein